MRSRIDIRLEVLAKQIKEQRERGWYVQEKDGKMSVRPCGPVPEADDKAAKAEKEDHDENAKIPDKEEAPKPLKRGTRKVKEARWQQTRDRYGAVIPISLSELLNALRTMDQFAWMDTFKPCAWFNWAPPGRGEVCAPPPKAALVMYRDGVLAVWIARELWERRFSDLFGRWDWIAHTDPHEWLLGFAPKWQESTRDILSYIPINLDNTMVP